MGGGTIPYSSHLHFFSPPTPIILILMRDPSFEHKTTTTGTWFYNLSEFLVEVQT